MDLGAALDISLIDRVTALASASEGPVVASTPTTTAMMPHTHSLVTMTARTRGILAGDGQDREWPHLAPRRQAPRIEVDPYMSTMIRHVIAGGGMCLCAEQGAA